MHFVLLVALLFACIRADVWQGFKDTIGVSSERLPEPSYGPIYYNTLPSSSKGDVALPGGPYAGSNVSVGGYVIKTPAGLFAGMSFVADGSTTGNLSINFNLDNDPALSLTCPNGQTGMKMISDPVSCLRRVGINILNPVCSLDVDDTICVNGVPIGAVPVLPLAWYYQIDQTSPCNNTNVQQYFTPSAIDQVTLEAIDTVFVGYQGGAIAFSVDNNTASFGDCRGTNAVDFQLQRSTSTEVASGARAFIAAGQDNTASADNSFAQGSGNTASGVESAVLGSSASTASNQQSVVLGGQADTASGVHSSVISSVGTTSSGVRSVAIGCVTCTNDGQNSVVMGESNQNLVGSSASLVGGSTNVNNNAAASLLFGINNIFGSNAGSSMFAIGQNVNITANTGAVGLIGSIFAGEGLALTAATPLPFTDGPVYILGKYNDPDNAGITLSPRVFTIGDGFNDTARSNLFSVLENGDVHTKFGGTYVTGGADFQEFFEHAEGAVKLPIGTTVKILEDGMFRKAQQGEIPDGVVSRRGGVLGNSDGHHWVGKYVMDDDTGKIKMEDGKRVISDKYDPSRPYIPREARDEWHTIGLVGQCEVLNGSPVDPRWVPMPRKAGARPGTTWYLIK